MLRAKKSERHRISRRIPWRGHMCISSAQIQDWRIPTIRFHCVRSASRACRNFQRKWKRRRKRRTGTLCQAPGRPATSKRSRYFPSELLSARRAPSNNSVGEKPARINGNFPFKMRNGRAKPAVDIAGGRPPTTPLSRTLFHWVSQIALVPERPLAFPSSCCISYARTRRVCFHLAKIRFAWRRLLLPLR